MLSLGVYPDVSLKDARIRRDDIRKLIANGVDPSPPGRKKKPSSWPMPRRSSSWPGNGTGAI